MNLQRLDCLKPTNGNRYLRLCNQFFVTELSCRLKDDLTTCGVSGDRCRIGGDTFRQARDIHLDHTLIPMTLDGKFRLSLSSGQQINRGQCSKFDRFWLWRFWRCLDGRGRGRFAPAAGKDSKEAECRSPKDNWPPADQWLDRADCRLTR